MLGERSNPVGRQNGDGQLIDFLGIEPSIYQCGVLNVSFDESKECTIPADIDVVSGPSG
ncbi:hypothetical protein StoSoilA2_11550 [Arthrobacter sp. StoSoilA2]|nr:hypothetical protein StoSoilA2_11550 [Arthrobacter sp. StoSoilA2]